MLPLLPEAVYVVLRETQPINLVGAFEEAITTQPRIAAAISALAAHATEVQNAYGETPVAAWTFGPGERLAPPADLATRGDADSTIGAVGEAVAARLS